MVGKLLASPAPSMTDRADIADLAARVKRGETVRPPLERAHRPGPRCWLVIERWEDGHTIEHGPVVRNKELADLFRSAAE